MEKLVLQRGKRISGCVNIAGSKNATLSLMVATLLSKGETVINNVPNIRDVQVMAEILEYLGATVCLANKRVVINVPEEISVHPPDSLVRQLRASVYLLGALLGRFGEASLTFPGGCDLGQRPVNIHIDGLRSLGATIDIEDGRINAKGPLHGGVYHFPRKTLGATVTLLLAAVLSKGKTKLVNCSVDPVISNLVDMLTAMGANIRGRATHTLTIEGAAKSAFPTTTSITVMPDRMEAGTYMSIAAVTSGELVILNCNPEHLRPVTDKMRQAGCVVEESEASLFIRDPRRLKSVSLVAEDHPGYPSDLQPQWLAMMIVADGKCTVKDAVFENRYAHVAELVKLGADIKMCDNTAVIEGKNVLFGTDVKCTDLRCGAALVIAGLVAKNETIISDIRHLDRGYETIEKKLLSLGVQCKRLTHCEVPAKL